MSQIFAVRLKPSGKDRVKNLLPHNLIAIGWSRAKVLLSDALSKDGYRKVVSDAYPDIVKRKRVGHDVNHLWRFIREMEIGDTVIVPHGKDIYFVRVTSEARYFEEGLETDTAIRRSVSPLLASPVKRSDLPSEVRHALAFRGSSSTLNHLASTIGNIIEAATTTKPYVAIEDKDEIASAIKSWRRAFEAVANTDHGYSKDLLWVPDFGIWLQSSGWEEKRRKRYWNGLGNRPGSETTRNLIVEVNPADGGLPGAWQGVIARQPNEDVWVLHRGLLNVRGVHADVREHLAGGNIATVTVTYSDGSTEQCLPVAHVGAEPLEVVAQSKRFMDACVEVRAGILDESPQSEVFQRKANDFEESVGTTTVGPKDAKSFDRTHARIANAMRQQLTEMGHHPSAERVGSLGPDMYFWTDDNPCLFEIKTGNGAPHYIKAVGQLLVYEQALGKRFRKFVVLPDGIEDSVVELLRVLEIDVIAFSKKGNGYDFEWPDDF